MDIERVTFLGTLGFYYIIMQSIWVGDNFDCIDAYVVLEWANDMKWHVFAIKHKVNTCHEHLIYSDDCVPI